MSGLIRPDDAAYHAWTWACGIPTYGCIEFEYPDLADRVNMSARWSGGPWGCAAPWIETSGLERPDTIEYHTGWFGHDAISIPSEWIVIEARQAMHWDWTWGCYINNVGCSGLEREDSIEYHAGWF